MKKWLYIVPAALILVVVLFFYVSFNGNFISKIIAKNSAQDYLKIQYPEGNYTLQDGHYNFKNGTYAFDLMYYSEEHAQNWAYTLEVGNGLFPTSVEYVTLHADSTDTETTELWNKEGSDYVNKLLKGLPISVSASYTISVPIGFTKETPTWQPEVPVPIAPFLYIDTAYYNGETKEQFLQLTKEIQQRLNKESLNYSNVTIVMNEKFNNSDGKKVGYAPIYYETKYYVTFGRKTEITIKTILE